PGADNLADALRQGLALLARQQSAKLVLARQDLVGNLLQRVVALLRRRARIGWEGRLGGSDGSLGLRWLRAGVLRDHLACVRRIDVRRRRPGRGPATADVILLHALH